MKIRQATLQDTHAIQQLAKDELGYDYPIDQTAQQLEKLLASAQHIVFVAVNQQDTVVGVVHGAHYESFYGDPALNILALAVTKAAHGQGIGRLLMQAIGDEARKKGYSLIRLNSGSHRIEAHQFYQKIGYQRVKEQVVFHRSLTKGAEN